MHGSMNVKLHSVIWGCHSSVYEHCRLLECDGVKCDRNVTDDPADSIYFFYYFYISIPFHTHTYIYFNFQFHKDILLPYSHVLLHCSPVHSETAVLKGPTLFLCTSTSSILSCPQCCPHMRLSFPHTALLIYSDNGKSTSRNVGTLLPDYT